MIFIMSDFIKFSLDKLINLLLKFKLNELLLLFKY